MSEVHHITDESKDDGVIFCEVQDSENSGVLTVRRKLLQNLYPGDCGYKYECRGMVDNLRESTSIDKVIILPLYSFIRL